LDQDGDRFVDIEGADFNLDGTREILMRNSRIGIQIAPQQGGSIYEFDYLPARYNLLNTLRRHHEGYHAKITSAGDDVTEGASIHDQVLVKEKNLDQYLIYDKHARSSSIDHFFSNDVTPKSLQNGSYYELGDFVNQAYSAEITANESEKSITLRRTGKVVDNDIDLKKTIQLLEKEDGLEIHYRIMNISEFPLTILFAPEFNFSMLAGESPDRYYKINGKGKGKPFRSMGTSKRVKEFALVNEADQFAVKFQFAKSAEVWRYPVETVSQSEGGFERVYQSSCVLPVYRLNIYHGKAEEISIKLLIEPLS